MSEANIYLKCIQAGMTPTGAKAMIGNAWEESGCESVRIQGDFKSNRADSKRYTREIDSGARQFDGQIGYGIYQWTFKPRQINLLNFARKYGTSVGDENMQIAFSIHELKTEFNNLWRFLCTTTDLYLAVDRVCREYENPFYKNVDKRYAYALEASKRLDKLDEIEVEKPVLKSIDEVAREVIAGKWGINQDRLNRLSKAGYPAREVQNKVNSIFKQKNYPYFWPPREISLGMVGDDVAVLQGLLIAHGFVCNINGSFDENTKSEIIKYQKKNNLKETGYADNSTWNKLIEL